MKKLALLAALILAVLCLTGCGNNGSNEKAGESSSQDTENRAETGKIPEETRRQVTAGQYVTFGRYEQDNNTGNGAEPVRWLVLEVQDGKALLISFYGLDCKPFNSSNDDITWAQCTLRSWLNGEFLNTAFSASEQSAILTTDVDNSSAQGYSKWSTSGGSNTQDKIFLLSHNEASGYLDSGIMPKWLTSTEYASARDDDAIDMGEGNPKGANWWLRSPGGQQNSAEIVFNGQQWMFTVAGYKHIVRPALWVDSAAAGF